MEKTPLNIDIEKRDRIINAAIKEFADFPYEKASTMHSSSSFRSAKISFSFGSSMLSSWMLCALFMGISVIGLTFSFSGNAHNYSSLSALFGKIRFGRSEDVAGVLVSGL